MRSPCGLPQLGPALDERRQFGPVVRRLPGLKPPTGPEGGLGDDVEPSQLEDQGVIPCLPSAPEGAPDRLTGRRQGELVGVVRHHGGRSATTPFPTSRTSG